MARGTVGISRWPPRRRYGQTADTHGRAGVPGWIRPQQLDHRRHLPVRPESDAAHSASITLDGCPAPHRVVSASPSFLLCHDAGPWEACPSEKRGCGNRPARRAQRGHREDPEIPASGPIASPPRCGTGRWRTGRSSATSGIRSGWIPEPEERAPRRRSTGSTPACPANRTEASHASATDRRTSPPTSTNRSTPTETHP